MQLPNNIYDKITKLSEEGNDFCEIDDFNNAIKKWFEAPLQNQAQICAIIQEGKIVS